MYINLSCKVLVNNILLVNLQCNAYFWYIHKNSNFLPVLNSSPKVLLYCRPTNQPATNSPHDSCATGSQPANKINKPATKISHNAAGPKPTLSKVPSCFHLMFLLDLMSEVPCYFDCCFNCSFGCFFRLLFSLLFFICFSYF